METTYLIIFFLNHCRIISSCTLRTTYVPPTFKYRSILDLRQVKDNSVFISNISFLIVLYWITFTLIALSLLHHNQPFIIRCTIHSNYTARFRIVNNYLIFISLVRKFRDRNSGRVSWHQIRFRCV